MFLVLSSVRGYRRLCGGIVCAGCFYVGVCVWRGCAMYVGLFAIRPVLLGYRAVLVRVGLIHNSVVPVPSLLS